MKSLCVLVMLFVLTACGQKGAEPFELTNLVIREMAPNRDVGVAYLTIANHSRKNLILNYVHSPRTDNIEVHQHLYDEGMMKMREVKHLNIDPASRLELVPGGFHLMLFGVDTPFKEGEIVDFTFEFQNHPAKTATARVKRL